MTKKRPDEVEIMAQISESETLVDKRLRMNFAVVGNVMDVARQYGIKAEVVPEGVKFTAPKSRMQIFVEKLHFAQVPYREV